MHLHIAVNTFEVQTQTPAQQNLIGHTMTAPPTIIAQQYSSTIFFSLNFNSRKGET
jgi:hypothetical protein